MGRCLPKRLCIRHGARKRIPLSWRRAFSSRPPFQTARRRPPPLGMRQKRPEIPVASPAKLNPNHCPSRIPGLPSNHALKRLPALPCQTAFTPSHHEIPGNSNAQTHHPRLPSPHVRPCRGIQNLGFGGSAGRQPSLPHAAPCGRQALRVGRSAGLIGEQKSRVQGERAIRAGTTKRSIPVPLHYWSAQNATIIAAGGRAPLDPFPELLRWRLHNADFPAGDIPAGQTGLIFETDDMPCSSSSVPRSPSTTPVYPRPQRVLRDNTAPTSLPGRARRSSDISIGRTCPLSTTSPSYPEEPSTWARLRTSPAGVWASLHRRRNGDLPRLKRSSLWVTRALGSGSARCRLARLQISSTSHCDRRVQIGPNGHTDRT